MKDAEGQQRTQGSAQDLAVSAVQFSDGGEYKGEWDILGKVGVRARVEVQLVTAPRLALGGGVVAEVCLVVKSVAHNTQTEEREVGRERDGEATCDGCTLGWLAKGRRRTRENGVHSRSRGASTG